MSKQRGLDTHIPTDESQDSFSHVTLSKLISQDQEMSENLEYHLNTGQKNMEKPEEDEKDLTGQNQRTGKPAICSIIKKQGMIQPVKQKCGKQQQKELRQINQDEQVHMISVGRKSRDQKQIQCQTFEGQRNQKHESKQCEYDRSTVKIYMLLSPKSCASTNLQEFDKKSRKNSNINDFQQPVEINQTKPVESNQTNNTYESQNSNLKKKNQQCSQRKWIINCGIVIIEIVIYLVLFKSSAKN